MSYITVKFIGKEYSIPQDVLTYIDLLSFTDSVQKQLFGTFVRKLKTRLQKTILVYLVMKIWLQK